MKRQFGFQKTRFRGMLKNRCKVNVLAALANLFMARHLLLPPPSGKLSPVLLTTRGLEEMTSASLQRGFQS
jgi:hypothetical protein